LRAILSVLAGAYRLGKRPIRQLVSDLLGLSISIGMIARLERQGAAELETPVKELREHVRAAASAHIDETSWWQGPETMWLWVARMAMATVLPSPRRGCRVCPSDLGTAAAKVVIGDRLKSYNWIRRRQFCWAHLRRDFQAMVDRGAKPPRSANGYWDIRPTVRLVVMRPGWNDVAEHLTVICRNAANLGSG
jgi:transposase